jgi:hypothetical protein
MVPNYASLVSPLDKLRNSAVIKWSAEMEACYEKVFGILKSGIMLSKPDFGKQYIIATDASIYGIGAVLYQFQGMGRTKKDIRFIKFVSRSLNQAED